VVLAMAARLVADGALALRAERMAEVRKTAMEDIVVVMDDGWAMVNQQKQKSRECKASSLAASSSIMLELL
jgi:hypothetical protein